METTRALLTAYGGYGISLQPLFVRHCGLLTTTSYGSGKRATEPQSIQ